MSDILKTKELGVDMGFGDLREPPVGTHTQSGIISFHTNRK